MRQILGLMMTVIVLACLVGVGGCGGDNNENAQQDAAVHPQQDAAGNPDGGAGDGPEPSCYDNPTTHLQIINACTTAQSVDIQPFYPAKAPNGQLPPLP